MLKSSSLQSLSKYVFFGAAVLLLKHAHIAVLQHGDEGRLGLWDH